MLPLLLVARALALTTPTDAGALCALADRIVVAEVTSTETVWAAGADGLLRTRDWVAVSEVLLGTDDGTETLEVLRWGGRLQGLVLTVEDQAVLRVDHRYVLLLTALPDGGWRVTGGEAGARPLPHGAPTPGLAEVCDAR
jgi:hypothetical protein